MKKGFTIALLINVLILVIYFQKDIVNYIININKIIEQNTNIINNEYKDNFQFLYVNEVKDISPNFNSEIKNIYYTILNSGMNKVTFYCKEEYTNCTDDILNFSNDDYILSALNNYVHPYNSYEYIATDIENNKNTIYITKNYTEEMIDIINKKVDEIMNKILKDNMNTREKIKAIHDYIINTTKYEKTNNSHLAYGALIENKAVCGGYTDAMSIFLYKLNIPNFKINNNEHIWNLVKIDDAWYHLDLTWDDPVNNYRDMLTHEYFLINTEQLEQKDKTSHAYDKTIFIEAN